MKVTFASARLKKCFEDSAKLQREVDPSWVRTMMKQMAALIAAENFGDFLSLRLWHPEPLEGSESRWSLRISANARLIIELDATNDTVVICTAVEVKGVCDYHGGKNNWYIQ